MRTIAFLPEHFKEIAKHIENGNPIILPTESSYGFSGSIESLKSIKTTENIKGRDQKPFLILVEDEKMLEHYGKTKEIKKFQDFISPQVPTTFLLPKTKNIPEHYFPSFPEIGIRICTYKPLQGLIHYLKKPIFSTSANKSGFPAIYNARRIEETFSHIPNLLFVSIGNLKQLPASRIIRINNNKIEEIRAYK